MKNQNLSIQYNNCGLRNNCPICQKTFSPPQGFTFFLAGTWQTVCEECGQKHMPRKLVKVIEDISTTFHFDGIDGESAIDDPFDCNNDKPEIDEKTVKLENVAWKDLNIEQKLERTRQEVRKIKDTVRYNFRIIKEKLGIFVDEETEVMSWGHFDTSDGKEIF